MGFWDILIGETDRKESSKPDYRESTEDWHRRLEREKDPQDNPFSSRNNPVIPTNT